MLSGAHTLTPAIVAAGEKPVEQAWNKVCALCVKQLMPKSHSSSSQKRDCLIPYRF